MLRKRKGKSTNRRAVGLLGALRGKWLATPQMNGPEANRKLEGDRPEQHKVRPPALPVPQKSRGLVDKGCQPLNITRNGVQD